jgi:acyl-CoA synthetase
MVLVPQEKIDRYVAAGWWGETTMGGLFLDTVARQPDALAVADAPNRHALFGGTPQRWSWQDLQLHVGQAVALMQARGLRKDDIVVMQLPNCVEMHAWYLACAISGIVVSPVPMQYRAHELSHVCASTGARIAITTRLLGHYHSAEQWKSHAHLFPSVEQIWAHGATTQDALPDGVLDLDAALAATPAPDGAALRAHMAAVGVTAHDVLTVCWTSGTEARAKGGAAQPQRVADRGPVGHRCGATAARRTTADPVPVREHGRRVDQPGGLAAGGRRVAPPPSIRSGCVP